MLAEKRLYFPILLFIYLLFCSSRFAISQSLRDYNTTLSNSTAGFAGLSSFWINRPSLIVNSTTDGFYGSTTPILQYNATESLLGILLYHNKYNNENGMIDKPQLVWSANRNHPVKFNATLQQGHDGNLVLMDFDGTLVWSTDTIGKSVSGLNLTEMGNLVLFNKRKRAIWQSFDHPTDSLLPGQNLISGRKLIASVSATNHSQGLLALTVHNGSWAAYTDTNPPQYYYTSYYADSPYYSFDGQNFTALYFPTNSTAQFMKIGPDGHIKVYQWSVVDWNEVSDILSPYLDNCAYPMVCGSYSICTNNGQCTCPKPDLGCSQLTSINCNSSQYHSFVELKNTTYFVFQFNHEFSSTKIFSLEGEKLEDCKRAWNCLLLNEVFSLTDSEEGRGKTVFLKVQNTSKAQTQSLIIPGGKKSRPFKVIIGSTLASFFGIILSIATCFVIFRKRTHESRKAADILDLAPILPGILTRFSYNELKIITDDFSRKLGEGGFGCVYEGTLRNGTKIAVKNLDGVGQVKESFLTDNLDWSQPDEEDVHLLSVFRRKAEQEQLMDMVDKNNEDMQLHREAVTEMMSLAAWCLQGDFSKRPSMSLVVKALEGLVTVETNLDYDFTHVPEVGAGNQQREVIISSKFPSILSGPR
ncbi:hypothetical protein R3W88_020414 [Solanum pinnatisectum]|nr:hypothetical protein R3W88_020414 [Solanum pinnatisectum]